MNWEFRVWDLTRQKMLKTEKVEVSRIETSVKVRLPEGIKTLVNSKRYPTDRKFLLMESSGITDKNGEMIFSEDILSVKGSRGVAYYQPAKAAFVVRELGLMGEEKLLAEVKEDAEVIGNVYENPEMLHVKLGKGGAAVERKVESAT
ncbi:YopX family protein [Mesotoga sp.]|uniref:YopX family protein n=1 Tax=Mesotoga sp. TaxID=2053577 RepID=UPI00345E50F7